MIAVSPIAWPAPIIEPVMMSGRTAGSSTRRIVAIFVLPTAYEASRTWLGIACRPSRTLVTTSGSASSDSIAPAGKNPLP